MGVDPQHTEYSYEYDALSRLTNAREAGRDGATATGYTYDTLGNLLTERTDGVLTEYTYNNLNQLTAKGSTAYAYDNRGNLVSQTAEDGVQTYVYDATDRMTLGTNPDGEQSEYVYNGLGYLVEHTTRAANGGGHRDNENAHGSETMGIFEDLFGSPPAFPQATWENGVGLVRQSDEQVRQYLPDYTAPVPRDLAVFEVGKNFENYTWGLDRISAELLAYEPGDPNMPRTRRNIAADIAVNDVAYVLYHQDRLGSTVYTTRLDGTMLTFAEYDAWGAPKVYADLERPFGVTTTETAQDLNRGGFGWTVSYTGHEWDAVLGVYYAKARLYDAEGKRFLAVDPVYGNLILPESINNYTYGLSNPLSFIDPNGMVTVKVGTTTLDAKDVVESNRKVYVYWYKLMQLYGFTYSGGKYRISRNAFLYTQAVVDSACTITYGPVGYNGQMVNEKMPLVSRMRYDGSTPPPTVNFVYLIYFNNLMNNFGKGKTIQITPDSIPDTPPTPVKTGIKDATAYARKHFDDGKGLCAEFCSDVLKAGGLKINLSGNAYRLFNQLIEKVPYFYLGKNGQYEGNNYGQIREGDLIFWDNINQFDTYGSNSNSKDNVDYNQKLECIDYPKFRDSYKNEKNDTVWITGGHVGYISVGNGKSSKFCAHNKQKKDEPIEGYNPLGNDKVRRMWLIKTSELF